MIPEYYDHKKVPEVYRVPYEKRALEAFRFRVDHQISPSSNDVHKVGLLLIDVQNTFCTPGFELFVGGRTGRAAVDDNIRLCEFIYQNLALITRIHATLDTHNAMQIFHSVFLVDDAGTHPSPMTLVTLEDVEEGRWKINPRVLEEFGLREDYLAKYCRALSHNGKYSLMVWPYHAMLGGIGHALVSSIEEAIFFHNMVRGSQTAFGVKGNIPTTEHYSVLRPEVFDKEVGVKQVERNNELLEELFSYDALVIAGQAKSHCVAWTVSDLLGEIKRRDEEFARRVYLLEDCSSPVVVDGVVDFSDQAEQAYKGFADAGMHIVRSSEPCNSWPEFPGL